MKPMTEETKDAKRDRIVAAATELMLDGGLSVTMDQIADKCGMAKGSLYLYFKDRDEMLSLVKHAARGGLMCDVSDDMSARFARLILELELLDRAEFQRKGGKALADFVYNLRAS